MLLLFQPFKMFNALSIYSGFRKNINSIPLAEHIAVILFLTYFNPIKLQSTLGVIALYYMNHKQPKDNENNQGGYSYG